MEPIENLKNFKKQLVIEWVKFTESPSKPNVRTEYMNERLLLCLAEKDQSSGSLDVRNNGQRKAFTLFKRWKTFKHIWSEDKKPKRGDVENKSRDNLWENLGAGWALKSRSQGSGVKVNLREERHTVKSVENGCSEWRCKNNDSYSSKKNVFGEAVKFINFLKSQT